MKVVEPLYSLDLQGDWVKAPTADPNLRMFQSPDRNIQVSTSGLTLNLTAREIETFARWFVKVRLKAESEAAAEAGIRKLRIAQPKIESRPWGYALAYYGTDDRGRCFNYSGAVTPNSLITIYAEMFAGAQADIFSLMRSIVTGLEFDRTPLRGGVLNSLSGNSIRFRRGTK